MAGSKTATAVRITRPMSLFLDAVQFGAACVVLLHHAAFPKFGTYLPWSLTRTGIEPVIAFFVLSGFVIAYTAEANDRTAYDYGLSSSHAVVVRHNSGRGIDDAARRNREFHRTESLC